MSNRIPARNRISVSVTDPDTAYIVVLRDQQTKTDQYTEGNMYLNNQWFAFTIEDKDRDLNKDGDLNDSGEGKVMHETCIPYGTYEVIVNMSPSKKRELPRLLNVKHFEGVLIHKGNTALDSSGCIIVGFKKGKPGQVLESTKAEEALVKELKKYKKIFIEIK
jgi:hypothetical protein